MKHLDGPGLTHLEIQQLVQVLTLQAQALERTNLGMQVVGDALLIQAQAIDRLAASNEALVDAMMALGERDEEPDPDDVVRTYMDGSPTGH